MRTCNAEASPRFIPCARTRVILFSEDISVYFGHAHTRARARIHTLWGCLLIKVHNLQTDRQSLGIQPSRMQNPAYIVYTCGKGKRERERERTGMRQEGGRCSLVLLEYPDISGSHCSLNSRAYPIYGALRFKTAICENNFNLGENHARMRAHETLLAVIACVNLDLHVN